MRSDTYTKAVLTVIAIMLSVIACKPLISPDTAAVAQGLDAIAAKRPAALIVSVGA